MQSISRVHRPRAAARSSYDRLSRVYDIITGESEKKYRDLGLEFLHVQPGETVLEIGAGTGKALVSLARSAGEAGHVCGVDLSEGMLSMAFRRLEQAGLAGRVELKCADAAALPYSEKFFDAAFLSFTLELFDTPEIPLVLQECKRVLKPGGRIAVVAMSALGKPNLMTRLYAWSHDKFPAAVDCRPIYAQAALETAGFVTRQSRLLPMWGLPVEIILAETAN